MENKTSFTRVAFILCLFICYSVYGTPEHLYALANSNAEKLKEKLNSREFSLLPLAFTENKGQVFGYDGHPHPEVKFSINAGNTQIFLLEKGIAYQFTKVHYPEGYAELISGSDPDKLKLLQNDVRTETFRMDMTLAGANQHARISREGKSSDFTNYYTHDVMDVHTYNKVTYHDVYPGIDWIIYIKNGEVKYDFAVKPGASPSQIKMQFSNHEALKINDNEGYTLENRMGKIIEKKPVSFQNEKSIATKFVLNGDIISFDPGNYNKDLGLIIDPSLSWATYYGGDDDEIGKSVAADASGNSYLAGYTASTLSIASGGYQNSYGGGIRDAFLVKFNAAGIRQWSTYYGGTGQDEGEGVVVDGSGNVYLAGHTQSSSGISSGGHQNTFGGSVDAFLVKFNSGGVRQWATYCGGTGSDAGWSCALDVSGNIYIVGQTASTSGIASGGHQNTYGGGITDGFLVKFNSAGTRLWGTYYGGSGTEFSFSAATDASGNIYLSGETDSGSGISSGGHQNTFGGGTKDAFLVKFNSLGARQWSTYYGGLTYDETKSCATDASGNIYLLGSTDSNSGIASGGYQNTLNGSNQDVFLAKFNTNGVRQWATYYGGVGLEIGWGCATDGVGNVYMTGQTNAAIGIASGGYQNVFGGGIDAFVVKFNASGLRIWGSYFGGTSGEVGRAVTTDASNTIYLAGIAMSTAGISSSGHQNAYGGGLRDAFLAKFCDQPVQPASISGITGTCSGSVLTFSVTNDPDALNYSWNLPVNWTGTSSTNIVNVTPMASGVLSVTANSACGSSPSQTVFVTAYSLPTITANSGSICSGQSFTIVPGGANTYSYSGGSNVVSPVTNTSYIVTGTSISGCTSTLSAISNVTVNAVPVVAVNSGSICSGQSFTILATGASTYNYSGGSNVVSPLANTSYSVTGTNTAGCTSTMVVSSVTVSPTPTISVNSGSICSGQSFTMQPTGASIYNYQGGSATVNPTSNSSYSVTGTSTAGCVSATAAISNITVHALPAITVNSGTICSGQTFTMQPAGASIYNYQGGSATVSPTSNSSYSVTGTSTAGCVSATAAISSITVHALPVVAVNSGSICSGESFTMQPTGASIYNIQGGSAIVSPASNASYSVTGTSTAGCISAAAISNITVHALPVVTVNSGTICSGESFTIQPSGANAYIYQGGSAVVSPLSNSSYTVAGTSSVGCISSPPAISTITVYALPVITVNSGTICSGQSFTMQPAGASIYNYQGGSATVNPISNSSYSVTGTNTAGCVSATAAIASVTVHPLPLISAANGTICNGQSFTLQPSGANTYTYQGGSSIVNPASTSQYTVSGTSSLGCISANAATITVLVNPLPVLLVSSENTLICIGETTTLHVNGANSYTWNTGSNESTLSISPPSTLEFTVTGKNGNNCSATSVFTQSVDACTSIGKPDGGENQVLVYPNPGHGEFFIKVRSPEQAGFTVYNSAGALILYSKIDTTLSRVDLSNFANGIYFIRIVHRNGITNKKLIKE